MRGGLFVQIFFWGILFSFMYLLPCNLANNNLKVLITIEFSRNFLPSSSSSGNVQEIMKEIYILQTENTVISQNPKAKNPQ